MVVKSPKRSLKGWNFKQWFVGNWSTIKEGLKVAIPAFVGWITTHHPAYTGLVTVGGKFLIDLGEYYFKEYKN